MGKLALRNSHKAKEFFVKSVGPNGYVYILSVGTVIPYRQNDNGIPVGMECLHAGSVLGWTDFLNKISNHITVYAKTNIELCAIHVDEFDRLRSRYPVINERILKMLSSRLKHAFIKLEYSVSNSIEKILYLLNELSEQSDTPIEFTHDELALLTGMNRVTATRVIEVLKQKNIIKSLGRGKFILVTS